MENGKRGIHKMSNYEKVILNLKDAIRDLENAKDELKEIIRINNDIDENYEEYEFEKRKLEEINDIMDEIESLIYDLS
jgi:predicted RNase H-like nuclease (RuvC/YqgF family)